MSFPASSSTQVYYSLCLLLIKFHVYIILYFLYFYFLDRTWAAPVYIWPICKGPDGERGFSRDDVWDNFRPGPQDPVWKSQTPLLSQFMKSPLLAVSLTHAVCLKGHHVQIMQNGLRLQFSPCHIWKAWPLKGACLCAGWSSCKTTSYTCAMWPTYKRTHRGTITVFTSRLQCWSTSI